MILTDTHTHLYYETDPQELDARMQRCFDNDILRLFLPNVDTSSIPMVIGLAEKYPGNCFPMLGLHPCNVKENYQNELLLIKNALSSKKIYAIGETGIDLYWDKTTLVWQEDAFIQQISWARERGLPVVIHCREAFEEVYEIVHREKDDKLAGIFHCFTGTAEQARKITDLGFYLGIGGVVTYRNSGLDKVVAGLSLENIILETDSPYLSPVPYRGKPNESSYLIYIAQKVADLLHVSVEHVAEVTTNNSKIIFGI